MNSFSKYKVIQLGLCIAVIAFALFLNTTSKVQIPGLLGNTPLISYAENHGVVKEWLFPAGTKVRKGQVVAILSIPSIQLEIQQSYLSQIQGQINHHSQMINFLIQLKTLMYSQSQQMVQNQSQALLSQADRLGEKFQLSTLQKALPSFKHYVQVGQMNLKDVLFLEGEIARLKARRHSLSKHSKLLSKQKSVWQILSKTVEPSTDETHTDDAIIMHNGTKLDQIYPMKNLHQALKALIPRLPISFSKVIPQVIQQSTTYSKQQQKVNQWIKNRTQDLQIIAPCDSMISIPSYPTGAQFNAQTALAYFYPTSSIVRAWYLPQYQQSPPSIGTPVQIHLPYSTAHHPMIIRGYIKQIDTQYSLLPPVLQMQSTSNIQGQKIIVEFVKDDQKFFPHLVHNIPIWVSW